MRTDTRFTQRFPLSLPIVQGTFGGGLSTVELAAAVSSRGALGSFGAHHLDAHEIPAVVAAIRARTDRPFAINLWVPQPEEPVSLADDTFAAHVARLRPYLDALGLDAPTPPTRFSPPFEAQALAALDAAPPVLSVVMGVPPPWFFEAARAKGLRVISTATTVDEAVALDRAGVDAVVASGADAGGHRGAFLRPVSESLVGTFSLVPQTADAVSCPLIAAGGIADGRGIAAALTLGADAVQVGTGFLACEESAASEAHRAKLSSPDARHTTLTRVFSGRTARTIVNDFARALAADEASIAPYPAQNWLTQPIRRAAALAGRAEWLSLWAGQAAPLTKRRRARDYLDALESDTDAAFEALSARSRRAARG